MPHSKAHGVRAVPGGLQGWLLRIGAYGSMLLGLSAIALIWFGALYFIHAERIQTERAALHNAANLARAFEEQIIRSIRAADQTLLYARDSYVRDPQRFDISLWSRNSEFLTGINFQVVIIDRNGRMVASNIPGSKPGLDLSDREHFKVHAQRQTDELFISKPVLGRVSGKWSIQLTRRITMADGSFGGVAVVSLDPDYLAQFYKSIDVGEDGVVALVGTDGIVRARGSKGASAIGQSLANGALFRAFARARTGSFVAKSQLDGIDRLVVYRAVRGYPLVVSVGLAEHEVFAAFAENRRAYLIVAAALTLWLLGMTLLIRRYQRGIAAARDAAEAGTRARSEFLATMSHEIRTPMNGVVGMCDVLAETELNAEQLVYARTLRESAEHLLQLINDVLDFSKLDADSLAIEQVAFDLRDLVEGSTRLLAATAKEKNLALSVAVAPDVPSRAVGDPARLRQVLFNLVGNGLKFTHKGGVAVTVGVDGRAAAPGRIALDFAIADTGIGIPADGIPLLFREFSQLDSSIARRFGGTGLGLAICRRLIGLMGGAISVQSEVGKGSTFRFTIAVLPESAVGTAAAGGGAAERDAVAAPSQGPPTHQPRILLVEDNRTNQLVATKLLQSLGHRADLASNGIEAVEACSAREFDLVLMDVMMPEMDGLAATRAIRALDGACGRPLIVALTANAMKQDIDMCLAAGMDGYLAKPVTRAGLRDALARFGGVAPAPRSARPPGAKAGVAAGFDASIYDELAEAIGEEDTAMLLDTFLADTPERIATMRASAKQGTNETVKREAHAIKSSAASLGFLHLSELARDLERDAVGLNWPSLDARIDEVERSLDDVRAVARTKPACRARVGHSDEPKGAIHA